MLIPLLQPNHIRHSLGAALFLGLVTFGGAPAHCCISAGSKDSGGRYGLYVFRHAPLVDFLQFLCSMYARPSENFCGAL